MEKLQSTINQANNFFPDITIQQAEISLWSPSRKTVYINPDEDQPDWILLHELGHALLNHQEFNKDIELLAIERDAWNYAKSELAPKFKIQIDQDFIEDHLDSYRDWLHTKSTCPTCRANGVEIAKNQYFCPICNTKWKTNIATQTQPRRYKLK